MKKKRKLKKSIKVIIFIIIILILLTTFNLRKEKEVFSDEVNNLLTKYNIKKEQYSKTLEYVLLNNIYDDAYLNEYNQINYMDVPYFQDVLTTFLPKGYSGKEINYILNLSQSNIDKLSKLEYTDISDYYKIANFDVEKIERYNSYKNDSLSIQDVVTQVNLNLDKDVYTNTSEVEDPNSLLVLVNKYSHLPKNYKPEDLVYLDGAYGNQVPVRSVCKDSFLELQEAAKNELNINLMPTTAYRSETFQKTLYDKYVASDGVKKADTYSARPSYSEHQTGLAIDLKNTALKDIRLTDDNFNWLSNNAYKYGFIIRFPENKENITLYQFENWHIRYVGKDVAKIIYEENLTLEEYIDLYVKKY